VIVGGLRERLEAKSLIFHDTANSRFEACFYPEMGGAQRQPRPRPTAAHAGRFRNHSSRLWAHILCIRRRRMASLWACPIFTVKTKSRPTKLTR